MRTEAMSAEHPSHVFRGVPAFFIDRCHEVKCRLTDLGYASAARGLVQTLEYLCPSDLDDEEWTRRIEDLADLVVERRDEAVLAWFVEHFPDCIALIPKRRRPSFLRGVYEVAEEEGIAPWRSLPQTPVCPLGR
jgi:hypothetical protein